MPKRQTSRQQFREFISTRGIFGTKRPAALPRPSAQAAPISIRLPRKIYILRYLRSLRSLRGLILLIVFLNLISIAMSSVMPWAGKFIIDYILPGKNIRLLFISCALLLGVGIAQSLLSLFQDYVNQRLFGKFITSTKQRMMKHLQQMPFERLQALKVGGIVTRLQSDTENMAGILQSGLLTPFNAVVMLIVGTGSLLFLNWQVTLLCLLFCILIMAITWLTFNLMRPLQKILREELAMLGAHVTETFTGIQIIRAFRREPFEVRKYAHETYLLWRKSLYTSAINMVIHRAIWILYYLVQIIIWAFGGYYVIKAAMKIGDLVVFIAFTQWIFNPIFMIMNSFSQLQTSVASAERVFDILDIPRDMTDRPHARPIDGIREDIRFDNVSFRYAVGAEVLTNVNFAIPRGRVAALVGPSGAGKSTIINLVMRFYDPTAGAVRIDGTDIRDFRIKDYRRLIALVPQDIFLFDGTIGDNIAYGNSHAGFEQIKTAARIANCDEFICNLKDRYHTIVGEKGVNLSMGQRQRIALARAILVDPHLLILDEATSNLDSESENLIQDSLKLIFQNRTTLVVAHRLSTIVDADKIMMMDKGRIVEEGTHEELLARQGRYYEFYTRQMEKTAKFVEIISD